MTNDKKIVDKVLKNPEEFASNPKNLGKIVDGINGENPDMPKGEKYNYYENVSDLEKGERLVFAMNRIALQLERSRITEYIGMMDKGWYMAWRSFVSGLFKGMGFGLGFLLMGALALYILNAVVDLGIPILGDFIADLLMYISQINELRN